jgi:hypothetical protein
MKTIIKQFIFFAVLVVFNTVLFCQSPDTLWTKTFGDSTDTYSSNFIQQTADSGYISVGTISPEIGSVDIILIKFDSNGDSSWLKRYDGGGNEIGVSAKQTRDGGFIIAGTKRIGKLDNIWLIKTNNIGNILWTKTFGDNLSTERSFDVQQTIDDGYIVLGEYFTDDNHDILLVKTDSNGDTIWTKTFGESYDDYGTSVQQTTDGGYIMAGKKGDDVWLIKTNGYGDTLWTKTFGGNYRGFGNSVQQTTDGGYIIAGYKAVSKGMIPPVKYAYDVWLIKTNGYGDTLWTKTYGDSLGDIASSVQQTTDGGYVITGSMAGDWIFEPVYLFVVKFDVNGNTLWTKIFGDNENQYRGHSIQQSFEGGYIIGGNNVIDYGNYYGQNIWLIKLAPDVTSIIKTSQNEIKDYILSQNYPNPFNPSTTIEFSLNKSEYVELKVYNIVGKEVATVVSNKLNQGRHTYTFDGKNLASGIYYYQLVAGDYRKVKKMILLK